MIPPRLWEALVVAVIGGLLTSVGSLFPVSAPAASAGFSSGPLLFVLGVLPVAVAIGFAAFGRPLAAGAALMAAAIFAPGRLVTNIQFVVDAKLAERPELLVPNATSGTLHAGIGVWLLLAGQVVTLIAGLLMAGQGVARSDDEAPASRAPLFVALCVGLLGAVGLLAAPFHSSTPEVLEPDLWSGPLWPLVGGLLLAAAAPLVATVAVTASDSELTPGWLFGGAASLVTVALPPLVAGVAVPGLHEAIGPYLVLVAALAMLVLTAFAVRSAERGDVQDAAGPELPGAARLHLAMAILGLVAAVAALLGSVTETFVLPAGLAQPTGYAERGLLPTAIIVGLLSLGMLGRTWAPSLRPVLAVALAAVPLAGAEALDAAFGGAGIDGVSLGPAGWFTGVALLAAAIAAICAAFAGGAERDDVDLSTVSAQPSVLVPAVLGVLLAVGAFGLPILRANGYAEAGIVTNFQVTSWGLLAALITVIIAGLIAPRCRPARAAGLLIGAATVLLVRGLAFPLTSGRVPHPSVGLGTWFALASFVVLLVAAGAAMATAVRRPTGSVGRARSSTR
ncbi:MAG TPA: hypothetical protein VG247_36845 [Pseudonocardiaceae bacterium]|nr:hypothetical protein [Pseudonocardiaceae bacterium]